MKISAALLFFAAMLQAAAQTPEVPHKMEFADLTLVIRDDAREEIQRDVDALTRSPKHYNIKAERAKTYFPVIERIFRAENVPDDFKYLVLQESALIADAVSVSDAVGFWQFKDFTAIEMGLRVDKEIDERMNIVSSTRGAARYLKRNNSMFNNWLFALQAYQMGAGGVMRSVKNTHSGAKRMEITKDTYWYVKKFLAHKIAFEPGVEGKPEIEVATVENRSGKSLKALARDLDVDIDELLAYNKWTKSGRVPTDRTYVVVVPTVNGRTATGVGVVAEAETRTPDIAQPRIKNVITKINGVPAIPAFQEETAQEFASRAGITVSQFLRWNDMRETSASGKLRAGDLYFIARKRARAIEDFHKLMPGESLWEVSQRYGVKLRKLRKYNRTREGESMESGTMLYLASKRPRIASDATPVDNALAVDKTSSFDWAAAAAANENDSILVEVVASPADTVAPLPVEAEAPVESEGILKEPVVEASAERDEPVAEIAESSAPTKDHVVAAGETLYAISRIYGVSVMQLVEWNGLDVQAGIKIGQVLKVAGDQMMVPEPVVTGPRDAVSVDQVEVIHEVRASDTLYSIARQFGVTIKELMDWNGKTDFSLVVGEKLKIRQQR